jgi:hypothetical protein
LLTSRGMSQVPQPPQPPPGYPHASAHYGYAPPAQVERPAVWPWFVAYAILMAVVYLLVGIFGATILMVGPEQFQTARNDADVIAVQGIVFVIIGPLLLVPFAIAPFLPRRPGAWVFDLVLICLGMTSCACLPITIPLLIFWLKPETKAWFGR